MRFRVPERRRSVIAAFPPQARARLVSSFQQSETTEPTSGFASPIKSADGDTFFIEDVSSRPDEAVSPVIAGDNWTKIQSLAVDNQQRRSNESLAGEIAKRPSRRDQPL